MINNKYKELKPEETINKIRSILNNIGIMPYETKWFNSAEEFYSVRIEIPNTDIGTNGKGTTQLFALASAYAELMERIQNMSPYKLSIDLDTESYNKVGFYFLPDEKKITVDEFLKLENEWLKQQIEYTELKNNNKELNKLIELWDQISYNARKNTFVGTPLQNLETKKITYVPQIMISKMYMSNGMCAGNTKEEAIVQGISEVIERYVNKKIIKEKITPPDVPLEYLINYPNIIKMIKTIQRKGPYSLMIKDCSLGENLPVIGAILHNSEKQSYFVKFGSFPDFEIAVERTLTEMLQGQNIKNMKGMSNFISSDYSSSDQNILGILVNGIGDYPLELFDSQPTYEFNPNAFKKFNSNLEIIRYYKKLFKEKNKTIFIRDATCFGFPTYQVIIPKFSEIEGFNNEKSIIKYLNYKKIKKMLLKLEELNDEDKKELIEIIKNNFHINSSPARLIGILDEKEYPWYYHSTGQLLTLLYCQIKDYNNAYKTYYQWLKLNGFNSKHIEKKLFAINNYLKFKKENKNIEHIKNFMSKYYQQEMINEILEKYENKQYAFTKEPTVNCFNCESCIYREKCKKYNNKELYIKIKEEIKKNSITTKSLI